MSDSRAFAVVPAAGRSARMGQPKLLLPWQQSTIIEVVLDAWQQSCVDAIAVVVRRQDIQLQAVCQRMGVEVVVPPVEPAEMSLSVQYALRRLQGRYQPEERDCWMLAPADMPGLSPAAIDRVRAAYRPDEPWIVVPVVGSRRGHPALFPWSLADDVFKLGEDEGINTLLGRRPVREIAVSDVAVCRDIDTPDEYAAMNPAHGTHLAARRRR